MSATISIDVDDRLTPALARLADAASDLTRPMALISEAVLTHTVERFNRQVSPSGVPWAARRHSEEHPDPGHPLLRKSGDLFNAIDRESGRDFAAVGVLATGGPAIYAGVHQYGATVRAKTGGALRTPFGPRRSATIPARPFLGIEDRDVSLTEAIITAHIEAAADGPIA